MALAEIVGVDRSIAAITFLIKSVDSVASDATSVLATRLVRQAQLNATGPSRWVRVSGQSGKYHYENRPREGGPGVVTGNLRRSIRSMGPRAIGVGKVEIVTGVWANYAASLEYGNPRWKRTKEGKGGYPFFHPAVDKIVTQSAVEEVWREAWRRVAEDVRRVA
jgi:hypothetical protein